MVRRSAAVLLVLALVLPAVAAQWPMAGRDALRTARIDDAGPDEVNIRWNDVLEPGCGESDPIQASAVLDGNRLVVGDCAGRVHAYNPLTGGLEWRRSLAGGSVSRGAIQGAAAADAGTVVVGSSDGFLRGLSASDGAQRWEKDLGSSPTTDVLAVDGVAYVGTNDGVVYAVDAADGSQSWRREVTNEGNLVGSFAAYGSWLFVPDRGFELRRYDLDTGLNEDTYATDGSLHAAPTADPATGIVYVADNSGIVTAVHPTNMTRKWEESPVNAPGFQSTPVVRGDDLFVGGEDGRLYHLNASTGAFEASDRIIDNPRRDDALRGQPALAGDRLYVPSQDGVMSAVETSTLDVVWQASLGGTGQLPDPVTSPVVWDKALYAASRNGVVWAIGPETRPTARMDVVTRGQTVFLDAGESTDPNDDPLEYTWDPGDGTRIDDRYVAYTYEDPGTYTVRLSVRDGTGLGDSIVRDVTVTPSSQTPWTHPRADANRSAATTDASPASWDVRWRLQLDGEAASAPVVGDGRVLVRTPGRVAAWNLDGDPLWSEPVTGDGDAVLAGSQVVVDGGTIRSLDTEDASERWATDVGDVEGWTVLPDGNVTAFNSEGDLVYLDGETGEEVWNASTGRHIREAPVPAPDRILVLTRANRLLGFDPATGDRTLDTKVDMVARDLARVGDRLIVTGSRSSGSRGEVQALDAADGSTLWSERLGMRGTGLAVNGSTVWVTTPTPRLIAIDLEDGSVRWRQELPAAPSHGPALGGPRIFLAMDDTVQARSAANGSELFTESVADPAGPLALHDGLLLATTGTQLVQVGPPPWVASFTFSPATPEVGENVAFRDTSVAPSGAEVVWDLGDGTSRNGTVVSHAYARPNNYTVMLRVGSDPVLVSRDRIEVLPAERPPGDDGDGDDDGTPPPTNDTGDGAPERPTLTIPGFEGAALVLAAVVALWVRGRRSRD